MTFGTSTYVNLVSERNAAQGRLVLQYIGTPDTFDIIIVGSGIGGGVLADELADRAGDRKRIVVLEAGSFIYLTHVYNFCRFSNSSVARHYECDTFWQAGGEASQNFIGQKPQLNFGGRSIFWSGLIPTIQGSELDFFPPRVRQDLAGNLLEEAGRTMNESRSMGTTAARIVEELRRSPLNDDFLIQETPRALHQPYLAPDGRPTEEFFTEPTGVFNTAELLINQLGLTPGLKHGDGPGLHLLLNSYVEDVQNHGSHYEIVARDTQSGQARHFKSGTVVFAAGSIGSPKLLRRSSMYPWLPDHVKRHLGRGLTDHPTSNEITTLVTGIGPVPIPKTAHAKIIFYSRGHRDGGQLRFPFNIEMNVNHEYWHLRENDPNPGSASGFSTNNPSGPSRIDVKFSFANPLDEANEIRAAPPFGYVPEVAFRNQSWMDHLTSSRFPALAGWQKSNGEVFDLMNRMVRDIFSRFHIDGRPAIPDGQFNRYGRGFGWGTVHHAAGSLRMPYRPRLDADFDFQAVLDEDLRVSGHDNLYVCDMSVMPLSTAANPVRTLVALALRLSRRLS